VAHHYEAAGDADNATVYYERAGQRARSLFAHAEALAHYEAALALGHGEPARIHEAMADISILGGGYTTALARYETAAALTDQHDRPPTKLLLGGLRQRTSIPIHNPNTTRNTNHLPRQVSRPSVSRSNEGQSRHGW